MSVTGRIDSHDRNLKAIVNLAAPKLWWEFASISGQVAA